VQPAVALSAVSDARHTTFEKLSRRLQVRAEPAWNARAGRRCAGRRPGCTSPVKRFRGQ